MATSMGQQKRLVQIGVGFWNARGESKVFGVNIGAQMSIMKISSGQYVVVDTVDLDPELKEELDELTENGKHIAAVVASHPFHSKFFPKFYSTYPNVPYYGTPRHLRIQPDIPWAGSMYDRETRQKWLPDIEFRIPQGGEFVAPAPETTNHFSGIHVFHPASRTIHVDDTIIIGFPMSGMMMWHPALVGHGLYHVKEAPQAFRHWVEKYIKDWDFDNIVAAHKEVKIGGAKKELQALLDRTSPVFGALSTKNGLFSSEEDRKAFDAMQAHEAEDAK